jgi:hypothetical protein
MESRVVDRLVSFLKSESDVFDHLAAAGQNLEKVRDRASAARKLAARLPSLPLDELRDLLCCFLRKVILKNDEVQVMISRDELRQLLENGGKVTTSNSAAPPKLVGPDDSICLSLEAKLKRYGGVLHLVVPPNPTAASVGKPNPSLVKAIARAHAWYTMVLEGNAFDQRSLARHAGFTERYAGKVFSCAFLAPDIVDAILQGRQPDDLTFGKLCKHVPLSWAEQRRGFGFLPAS